jgi:uncharacterized protein YkwD
VGSCAAHRAVSCQHAAPLVPCGVSVPNKKQRESATGIYLARFSGMGLSKKRGAVSMLARSCCVLLSLALLTAPLVAEAKKKKDKSVETAKTEQAEKKALPPADTQATAELIVADANEFRRGEGRGNVVNNQRLAEAALDFAKFLSRHDTFSHQADGRRPEDRAQAKGYEYCVVLENIAYRFSSEGYRAEDLAREFVQGWKDSPGHRKNMLNGDITETGVAVLQNKDTGFYYAVQMFGLPISESYQFGVANNSGVDISYAIGNHSFSLAPGYVRQHHQCGAAQVEFQGSNGKTYSKATPVEGDQFKVVKDGPDRFRVTKETDTSAGR